MQIYLMKNALNGTVADVFDTYVYLMGITQGSFSYSTAVGLFKSVELFDQFPNKSLNINFSNC